MGKLINITEFGGDHGLDYSWYFPDYYFKSYDGIHMYSISSGFPFNSAIHCDVINFGNNSNLLKIEIRKWIESNLSNIVITNYINKNYTLWYGKDTYDRNHRPITHGYQIFNFETSEDHVYFKLRFMEYLSEIKQYNPAYYYMTRANNYYLNPYTEIGIEDKP